MDDSQYTSPQTPAQPAPQQGQPAQPSQRPPLKIDNNLLIELGLGSLPQPEKSDLLKHIYETLEMRVGMRLADQMTNEQLDEFETYFNARDDAGAFRWLETNFPNYKDIVAEEFDKLKVEVGQNAPHILAASQQQAQMPPQTPVQPMEQPYQQPQQPPVDPSYPPQPQQPPVPPIPPQDQQPPQQPPAY